MDMRPLPKRDELITVDRAREVFGLSERVVWYLIRDHGLQRYRLPGEGKRTFVRIGDLARAVATPIPQNQAPPAP